MKPDLSRLAASIVYTNFYWSLSFEKRQNFIKDLEKASKLEDLSPENQNYWRLAEDEIKSRSQVPGPAYFDRQ